MKKFYFLISFLLIHSFSYSQEPFVTTWEVSEESLDIIIPTYASTSLYYDYSIDFGDGNTSTVMSSGSSSSVSHTYSQAGIYTVSISGVFPRIYFYSSSTQNSNKIKSVEQWGDIEWASMERAFYDCTYLDINAVDIPDLSQVTSMSNMFFGANFLIANESIGNWDVSNITNMASLFSGASSFNRSLNWDVSNVIYMSAMFFDASSFNQPLDNWDVSNVISMSQMYTNAYSFNQPLNNWDVSNVIYMNAMFFNAYSFNHPLDNWDVSSVTDMGNMFHGAETFNQPLNSWDFSDLDSDGLGNFLNGSNLDVTNYDNFLNHLASSNLYVSYLGVDGLEYCNQGARDYLINTLGWTIIGDSLSDQCITVSGAVLLDSDNNGCTIADIPSGGFFVNLNNGTNDYATSVTNGSYSISTIEETYIVSLTNLPDYFTANPVSVSVDFSTTTDEQVDFCLTANQTVNDLNITLLPLDDARPGFESNYKLVIENIGTEIMNNITASLSFDETKQSFVSSNQSTSNSSANNLEFSIASLNPFQKQDIEVVMQIFAPPSVNGDDILNFTAVVLPDVSDDTPDDNTFMLEQIVVNSYDPNDKRVLQGDFITIDETGQYLDYIIRFQNTGTANAAFVRIEDELDADLDWSTLRITSASHAYGVSITNGNEVEFLFDNINLPYEALDEEGSNGYIAYKIKPKTTVEIGDIMSGDASIYFDYNSPIITNEVSTEVVTSLSVDEFNYDEMFIVYPNPSDDGFFIRKKNGVTVESYEVYNIHGSKLLDFPNTSEYIDTSTLVSGVYLLVINSNQGSVTKKIMIK